VALPAPLSGPSAVYASLLDRLVVLDDLAVEPGRPYGWSPIPLDKVKGNGAFSDWFALPWGGPRQIVLPGYHTAAENGLKPVKGTAINGQEIFLNVTALMSGGAQTVLLSRWRTGGQTSFNLVREFVQELPHTWAVDAWRRSVELAMESPLNSELESRVGRIDSEDPPPAVHPFFWSGYLLVDTGSAPEGAEPQPDEPAPVAQVRKPAVPPQPKQPIAKQDEPEAPANGLDHPADDNEVKPEPNPPDKKPTKRPASKKKPAIPAKKAA
jgi:hypothetical protein